MPKILFVNEHREVDVASGRRISDVAAELGIQVCREEFAGTGIGDYSVWVQGKVSPMTFYERVVKRCKGERRMANRTKVLGDVRVWTQGGLGSRQSVPRPLEPAARAGEDGSEMFDHANEADGTAWHPYGHPHAVGKGTREPFKYVPKKKKTAKAKKAAAPAPAPAPDKEPEAEAAADPPADDDA